MNSRSNNPVGFGRLLSLRATWSPCGNAGEPGELNGSLNFSHQIVGDDSSPIKFRLELTGAELLIKCPADTRCLEDSVMQPDIDRRESSQSFGGGEAEVGLNITGGKLRIKGGELSTHSYVESSAFKASAQDVDGNPIFEFEARDGGSLRGPAWPGFALLMKVKSLKPVRPFDPEPVLYVRATGDQLKIIDPVLNKAASGEQWKRNPNKRFVALAYLRKCLTEDLSLNVDGELKKKHSMATLLRYEPQTKV